MHARVDSRPPHKLKSEVVGALERDLFCIGWVDLQGKLLRAVGRHLDVVSSYTMHTMDRYLDDGATPSPWRVKLAMVAEVDFITKHNAAV